MNTSFRFTHIFSGLISDHLALKLIFMLRPDGDILFPSRSTICNTTKIIRTTGDIMKLTEEFKILPTESIIQKHFVHESSSGMNLQNLLAAEIYISKYNFQ